MPEEVIKHLNTESAKQDKDPNLRLVVDDLPMLEDEDADEEALLLHEDELVARPVIQPHQLEGHEDHEDDVGGETEVLGQVDEPEIATAEIVVETTPDEDLRIAEVREADDVGLEADDIVEATVGEFDAEEAAADPAR